MANELEYIPQSFAQPLGRNHVDSSPISGRSNTESKLGRFSKTGNAEGVLLDLKVQGYSLNGTSLSAPLGMFSDERRFDGADYCGIRLQRDTLTDVTYVKDVGASEIGFAWWIDPLEAGEEAEEARFQQEAIPYYYGFGSHVVPLSTTPAAPFLTPEIQIQKSGILGPLYTECLDPAQEFEVYLLDVLVNGVPQVNATATEGLSVRTIKMSDDINGKTLFIPVSSTDKVVFIFSNRDAAAATVRIGCLATHNLPGIIGAGQ